MERVSVIQFNTEKHDFTDHESSNTKYIPTFFGRSLKQQKKRITASQNTEYTVHFLQNSDKFTRKCYTNHSFANTEQTPKPRRSVFFNFFNLNHWIVSCRLFNYSQLTDVQKYRRTAKTSETSMYDTEDQNVCQFDTNSRCFMQKFS